MKKITEKNAFQDKEYTSMPKISIISANLRTDRKSHSVALYFHKYLSINKLAKSEILNLKKNDFPTLENTINTQKINSKQVNDFANKIKSSEGIIIVSPEYKGVYPAILKNIIEQMYKEWLNKPIVICTVSPGPFGGNQALISHQFSLWKIGAWTVTNMFCGHNGHNVTETNEDQGNPLLITQTNKLADAFIKELLECVAKNKKK